MTATSDGRTYTYDANGNMKSDGQRTIAYNYDNMPKSITLNNTITSFVYNRASKRVKKITPLGTTIYIGKLYECTEGGCSKYIFAGDTRIALKQFSNTYYYHQDHLGSSRVVTDSTGSKVEEIHYYPYGTIKEDSGSISFNHKYTSQEFDSATGLYYYGARYYNPQLGRFISPDSIISQPWDPQSFNRYSYVRNNPLVYTDPTGHSWFSESVRDNTRRLGLDKIKSRVQYMAKETSIMLLTTGLTISYMTSPLTTTTMLVGSVAWMTERVADAIPNKHLHDHITKHINADVGT